MKEKKLTYEQIIKALDICYNSPCCNADCPYFNKNGRDFCKENKAFYRDLKRIVQEHAEQKAEIERLTKLAELRKRDNEDTCKLLFKEEEKQAVKDTAKEILSMFDDRNYISEKDLKKAIAERYGLEVE